jgi:hypothetical protein
MTIGVAMNTYFKKLKALYKEKFGTAPSFPYDEDAVHGLFCSAPDEDGYALWQPKMASPVEASVGAMLCPELAEFYGSWYFLQMNGRIGNIDIDFFAFDSRPSATEAAKSALADGKYYFPQENCALIASCTLDGADGLLMFYDQNSGKVFIYDADRNMRRYVNASLGDIIAKMEALI